MIGDRQLMNEESTIDNRQAASGVPTQYATIADCPLTILRSSIADPRSSMCIT